MNAKSFDSTIYTNIKIIEVSMMKDLCAIKITEESLPFIYKNFEIEAEHFISKYRKENKN